jgi:hypothetical protein
MQLATPGALSYRGWPLVAACMNSPIPLSCRSAAVNGDCVAPCALSCGKPFPARAADRHDGAPSGRAPSPWLCTGSRRLCARKCGVPPRRRGGDVQGASGRIDSWLNTTRRRKGFASFASKRRIPGICVALLFAWRYWGPPGPGKWADLG